MTTTTTKADRGRYGLRAPKGGCTVAGKVYRGGQFCLPFDPANPHGVVVEVPVFEPTPAPVKFAIFGFNYEAREIPANECGSIAFELHKLATNNHYHVIRDGFGEITCSCPDFEFRRASSGQPCKHGRKLIDLGMIEPGTPARKPEPPTVVRFVRPRRFVPSPAEMAEAAQLFADMTACR